MLKKYGWVALLLGLGITYIGMQWLNNEEKPVTSLFDASTFKLDEDLEPKTYIYIDIKGAVMVPGVYRMESDHRIFDAIERAGGFHPDASRASINEAGFLTDGQRIDVLFETESLFHGPASSGLDSKISLNQASQSELESLSGIGPQTALSIIAYREKTPFKSVEDLLNVSGIGEVTYQSIKDQIIP